MVGQILETRKDSDKCPDRFLAGTQARGSLSPVTRANELCFLSGSLKGMVKRQPGIQAPFRETVGGNQLSWLQCTQVK